MKNSPRRSFARFAPVRSNGGLADELVVLGMRPDPEPHQPVIDLDRQGAMMTSGSHRPEATGLLEMERWVAWIALETLVRSIGDVANALRQGAIARPKVGGRVVLQMGVVLRPA